MAHEPANPCPPTWLPPPPLFPRPGAQLPTCPVRQMPHHSSCRTPATTQRTGHARSGALLASTAPRRRRAADLHAGTVCPGPPSSPSAPAPSRVADPSSSPPPRGSLPRRQPFFLRAGTTPHCSRLWPLGRWRWLSLGLYRACAMLGKARYCSCCIRLAHHVKLATQIQHESSYQTSMIYKQLRLYRAVPCLD